jgi:hypothetical protein
MNTHFSIHAFERASQRLSMTHAELAFLLDEGLTIEVGREQKAKRVHRLFYSPNDAQCFVAIQDSHKGTVITVLPMDYHERICWVVSVGAQKKAKALLIKEAAEPAPREPIAQEPKPITIPKKKPKAPPPPPSSFTVEVYGFADSSKRIKMFKWAFEPPVRSINALIEEDEFAHCLVSTFSEKSKDLFPQRMNWLCIENRATKEIVAFDPTEVIDERLLACA